MLTYRPLAEVEQQIEDHYRHVQLTAEGLDQTGAAVLEEIVSQQDQLADEQQRQSTRLRQLEAERTKLLHAFYQEAITVDLLKSEQDRIATEIATAASPARRLGPQHRSH